MLLPSPAVGPPSCVPLELSPPFILLATAHVVIVAAAAVVLPVSSSKPGSNTIQNTLALWVPVTFGNAPADPRDNEKTEMYNLIEVLLNIGKNIQSVT